MTGKPRVTKTGPHAETTIRSVGGEWVSVGPVPTSRVKMADPDQPRVWLRISLDRDEDGYDDGCDHVVRLTADEAANLRAAITAALAVRWEAP